MLSRGGLKLQSLTVSVLIEFEQRRLGLPALRHPGCRSSNAGVVQPRGRRRSPVRPRQSCGPERHVEPASGAEHARTGDRRIDFRALTACSGRWASTQQACPRSKRAARSACAARPLTRRCPGRQSAWARPVHQDSDSSAASHLNISRRTRGRFARAFAAPPPAAGADPPCGDARSHTSGKTRPPLTPDCQDNGRD